MNKKLFALVAALLMLTGLLAACTGGSASTPSTAPAPSTASTPVEGGDTPEPAEGLRIAIVTSPSGVDDGSFNQNNYEGIEAFIAANPGATVQAIRETDINNSVPAVESIVADYDVIVTPGFQFASISQVAMDNPGKYFILVDSFPTSPEDPAETIEVDNIYAIQFAEEESGFFAGIAAALETETGKVAVVNGLAYPSNVNYQYGFMSGVNYANAKLGASATIVELPSYAGEDVTGTNVGGNYIGSFDDEATGKVVGEALLAEGCDILFVAAGGAGNGVFAAVKENGSAKVIGCDVDQYDDGVNGDANIILTSVLKVMDINVERSLNAIQEGTFAGGNATLGADTDSTGYVSEAGRQQMSDDTLTALADAYDLLKAGTIDPAANFNGFTPDDFPGLAD